MKIAVVYLSQSGQTEKVALAIADALPQGTPVLPMPSAVVDDYDLLFVGMPIHNFTAPNEARSFLEGKCAGRPVALFVTHASPEGPGPLQDWLDDCRDAATCADVVGFFDCQGELAEPVKTMMFNSGRPELQRWAEADTSQGQPDEDRLAKAKAWASDIVAGFGSRTT